MAREHRILKDGEITVIPFTPAEEADADQNDIDLAALNTPTARVDRAFTLSDKDRVIFEALFEIANRLQALESKNPITRAQLKTWLQNKLP